MINWRAAVRNATQVAQENGSGALRSTHRLTGRGVSGMGNTAPPGIYRCPAARCDSTFNLPWRRAALYSAGLGDRLRLAGIGVGLRLHLLALFLGTGGV